jgi:hypothetical protein
VSDPPPSSEERYRATVVQLALMVDVWRRILVTHARTPDGFCAAAVCRRPGTGKPHVVYPCPVRVAACHAEAVHRSGDGGGDGDQA